MAESSIDAPAIRHAQSLRRVSRRLISLAGLLTATWAWPLVATLLSPTVAGAVMSFSVLGDPFVMLGLVALPTPDPGSGAGSDPLTIMALALAAGSLAVALMTCSVALALRAEAWWAMSWARLLGWGFLIRSVVILLWLSPWVIPELTSGAQLGSPYRYFAAAPFMLTSAVHASIVYLAVKTLRTLATIQTERDIHHLTSGLDAASSPR